ncbi:S-layer homology domain-containing protein [Ruminiclostridium herbifermentans]|uniref:S-layer homology domain-containing protein n=1 Tax=Ruminiclostridium herbifermentans TaxID=2488810 RepID=A0A4U7JNR5_9FIRM|nr:S-layer homology domain-containing protein [Ruminiclostridium herbifermentans]QNU68261.1 S-layer homology domain-containing protein [Ruminiclostridium herbifermentans]
MKKIISMLLVVVMMITFIVPAMASDVASEDNALAIAIKAVREKIEIPEECNIFNYYINNKGGLTSFNLEWTSDTEGKSINVSIDENNLIRRYYWYDRSTHSYEKKIPKFSEDQSREIAEKFINNLDSKLLEQYSLIKQNITYREDSEYIFSYVREANGIKYYSNDISISVNKFTGDVSNYTCNHTSKITFEDASKIISNEQAKKAFIDKLGLKLVYMIKTKDNMQTSYLAYVPKYSNKYIDGLTGEVEDVSTGRYLYDEYGFDTAAKSAVVAAAGGNINLTPEELEAVKSMSDVMSKENADKKVRGISFFGLDDSFKLANSYLSKDWRDNESFIWYLNYKKEISKDKVLYRDIQIDAKTGEIQNFGFTGSQEESTKPKKTEEEAKAICEDVLKSLMPGKYDKLKYDDSYSVAFEKKNQDYYTFRFVRMENGVECPDNYVQISYDNVIGNVSGANSNWSKNTTFEVPKNIIAVEKIYDILFDKIGYDIRYVSDYSKTENEKVWSEYEEAYNAVLGYFINTDKPSVISAKTGDILDNSGEVYIENEVLDYTDIEGLKAENEIKILTQMSIRYFDSQLKPKENLLQKDYFILLCQLNNQFYFGNKMDDETIENMYNSLIYSGIITKEEKAPTSAISREEAAKYFVRFLGYKNVAEIKGIYKSNFKDANKIDPDLLGYVCIASGLKAMNGSNGNFNPKNKMTRLEGLLSIYSYLSNK